MTVSHFMRILRHNCSFLALGAGLSLIAPMAHAAEATGASDMAQPYQNGWGFDQHGMDLTVNPGDDFYKFANGTYIKRLKIPDDMSSYGAFHILSELSLACQKTLLENLVKALPDPVSETGKLGLYYAGFMNQKEIDRLGKAPLETDLNHIKALQTPRDIARIFGESAHSLMFSTFAFDIEQDQRDPGRYMLLVDQGMSVGVNGGLGLPDISYYTDPKLADKKTAYQAYIAKMFTLAGWSEPVKNAESVVALETALAKVELPRGQTRDPIKTFNPMTIAQLKKLAPEFDWEAALEAMGVPGKNLEMREIDVREPQAIKAMSHVLSNTDVQTLRSWLAFHLIDNAAPYLSQDFSKASFDFNGKTLLGVQEEPVRWKRAVRVTNQAMGWALGRIYVQHYFPAEAKAQITTLVADLKKPSRRVWNKITGWMMPRGKQL